MDEQALALPVSVGYGEFKHFRNAPCGGECQSNRVGTTSELFVFLFAHTLVNFASVDLSVIEHSPSAR